MDARHTKKAFLGLAVGLPLLLGGAGWLLMEVLEPGPLEISTAVLSAGAMLVVSTPFYLWGCAELAQAKGYSSALVLTCVLGWLPALVIILALPDKLRHHRPEWAEYD